MKDSITLSLRNWPRNPLPDLAFDLTPNTVRTLRKAQITMDAIIPISVTEFRLENNFTNKSIELLEAYEDDKVRRRKKVEILQELWLRIAKKRKNPSIQKETPVKNRKQQIPPKTTTKEIRYKNSSPTLALQKTNKSRSDYNDYCSYLENHKKNGPLKKKTEQDSTVSKRKNSKINFDYFEKSFDSPPKDRRIKTEKNHLLQKLGKIMEQWIEIDNQSTNNENLEQLQEHEKKRLSKVYKIEKQKLRRQMKEIRVCLNVKQKLNKVFN